MLLLTVLASLIAAAVASYGASRLARYLTFTPRRCWLTGHRPGWENNVLRGSRGEPLALVNQCQRCDSYVVTCSTSQVMA